MPYDLSSRLVVGLASSALFDLSESDAVFQSQGEAKYREYQQAHQDEPLGKGVAFDFIARLLALNTLAKQSQDNLVEVILLSRNDPDTGLRVMNSIKHYDLDISRAMFLQGRSPYPYINALNIELFLSANFTDVQQAVAAGYPAGHIQTGLDGARELHYANNHELRIAFDFDGVIADDEAERIYKQGDLEKFHAHEASQAQVPLKPGPLQPFLKRIAHIQKLELEHKHSDAEYQPVLRVSIVTARNAPAHTRVINTMRDWGIVVNEAFFMGGVDKAKVLDVLKPHIFFDDQRLHLDTVASHHPSVHIPFGVANQVDNESYSQRTADSPHR